MTLEHYLLFGGISVLQVGSPGPSTVFVVDNAIAVGWLRAILILTGDLLAIAALALLSLLGVDALLIANPRLFAALKISGALYLLWLGVNQWIATQRSVDVQSGSAVPARTRALWIKSFLIGISNPKAILFFSSLLPQFVDPTRAGSSMMLQLVALFVAIKFVVLSGYAGVAARALPLLRSGGNARWGKRLTGTVLICFGGVIALSAIR